jgi:hypothetical protein
VTAIQAANGAKADGGIVYLSNGTYSLSGVNAITTNEWLTIALASGAAKASTIINVGYATMDKLHVKGITIEKSGSVWVFAPTNHPDKLWVDGCELVGSGLWVSLSSPMNHGVAYQYITDSRFYNIDYATRNTPLIRNTSIEHFGNDAMFNSLLAVNVHIEDQDNGTTGWHSDGYQAEYLTSQNLPVINNRILFNVKMLDMHTQCIYMQSTSGPASDVAFVNVHSEQREPPGPNESGSYNQTNFYIQNSSWDNVIVWNCSFPYGPSSIVGNDTTNSSFVGNLFWQFRWTEDMNEHNTTWAQNGNSQNNEVLHNHFMHVYQLTPTCTQTSADIRVSHPCPQWYAKRPDSGTSLTATIGEADIESIVNPMPQAGSPLLDRFPSKVPVDIDNRERGATSDVGAYEYNESALLDTTAPTSPTNLSVE